jgi:hypothetical protein
MNTHPRSLVLGLAFAAALGLGACAGTTTPTLPALPTLGIPTQFPDDLKSGTAACINAPTMAIIDQLRAQGADVPNLLAANKDALIAGLSGLDSSDPTVTDWRDAFLTALDSGDIDAAAAQVARLSKNEIDLTPC